MRWAATMGKRKCTVKRRQRATMMKLTLLRFTSSALQLSRQPQLKRSSTKLVFCRRWARIFISAFVWLSVEIFRGVLIVLMMLLVLELAESALLRRRLLLELGMLSEVWLVDWLVLGTAQLFLFWRSFCFWRAVLRFLLQCAINAVMLTKYDSLVCATCFWGWFVHIKAVDSDADLCSSSSSSRSIRSLGCLMDE